MFLIKEKTEELKVKNRQIKDLTVKVHDNKRDFAVEIEAKNKEFNELKMKIKPENKEEGKIMLKNSMKIRKYV